MLQKINGSLSKFIECCHVNLFDNQSLSFLFSLQGKGLLPSCSLQGKSAIPFFLLVSLLTFFFKACCKNFRRSNSVLKLEPFLLSTDYIKMYKCISSLQFSMNLLHPVPFYSNILSNTFVVFNLKINANGIGQINGSCQVAKNSLLPAKVLCCSVRMKYTRTHSFGQLKALS